MNKGGVSGAVGPSGVHYGHKDCQITKHRLGDREVAEYMIRCTCPRVVNWGQMTAREVWDALVSAPKIASPWEPGELGQMDVRRALDGTIVATTLWVTPRYPTAPWRVAVATSDRSGADAILREHGWLLPEGE